MFYAQLCWHFSFFPFRMKSWHYWNQNDSWDLTAWKQMFYYSTLVSQYINSAIYFHASQQYAMKFNRPNQQLQLQNWISLLLVFCFPLLFYALGFFQFLFMFMLASLKCKLMEVEIHLRQNWVIWQTVVWLRICRIHILVIPWSPIWWWNSRFQGVAALNNNNKKSKLVLVFQTIFVLTLY